MSRKTRMPNPVGLGDFVQIITTLSLATLCWPPLGSIRMLRSVAVLRPTAVISMEYPRARPANVSPSER